MRLALLGDIHGYAVALDAVLAVLERDAPDRVACLGDVAATGPDPAGALARVRDLGCPVVMGNADAWLLDPGPDDGAAADGWVEEVDRWCRARLTADDLAFVAGFAPAVEVRLEEATVLCVHGSPRSFHEPIRAATPDEEVTAMLGGRRPALMAAGHTHEPLLRRVGATLIVNPGSVGMPYERTADGGVRNPPWAEYALVEARGGALSVALRRVPVEAAAVREAILTSGLPHAEALAADWR